MAYPQNRMVMLICRFYLMNKQDIKETLVSLGYNLQDRGEYWQCSALYRNGDNTTALQIYKDTGVWKDYVQGTCFMPFKKLVQVTLKTTDENVLDKFSKEDCPYEIKSNLNPEYLKMEKTYDKKLLEKLLPHYSFYKTKNISVKTLEDFEGGLCTEGQMYQRFVFPIYNLKGQIHGFSGRNMSPSNDSRPKWKHIGMKSKWVYPFHLSSDHIKFEKEVILVESIGDCLSLYENGVKNFLCTFGVDLSPTLISYLTSFDLDKIILSFNNDRSSNLNPGLHGCLKSFFKLIPFFDYKKINICLPTKNDFGDMKKEDFENWKNKKEKIQDNQVGLIIDQTDLMISKKSMPKTFLSKFKKFKKNYEG